MNQPDGDFVFCTCGADNPNDATSCWLCQRALPGARTPEPGAAETSAMSLLAAELQTSARSSSGAASPEMAAPRAEFGAATLVLWLTLGIVGLGVLLVAPGLWILLSIVAMPALVRTSMVVGRRSREGEQVPLHRKIVLFLGSLATSVIVMIVVLVAAVGSFCAVCLGAGTEKAIPLAAMVAIGVTSGVVFLMWKWIRSRWRRDIKQG